MPRLVATYHIPLPSQCMLQWPEGHQATVSFTRDEFNIDVKFHTVEGAKHKYEKDPHWTYYTDKIELTISREEQFYPPLVVQGPDGITNWSFQKDYFDTRKSFYNNVAHYTANCIIDFFRYELKTPLLSEFTPGHQVFQNPVWTDEQGAEVFHAGHTVVIEKVPGSFGELGTSPLTPNDIPLLAEYISKDKQPSLADEILSNAQGAWFEGNLRRCVLELAIACEVISKRKFFSENSPAGVAFDYLEDKSRVSVKVLDIIDTLCLEAFSKSFKIEHKEKYQNIDYLFRCRNKVAHRGELTYRDVNGTPRIASEAIVNEWYESTLFLRKWIDSL